MLDWLIFLICYQWNTKRHQKNSKRRNIRSAHSKLGDANRWLSTYASLIVQLALYEQEFEVRNYTNMKGNYVAVCIEYMFIVEVSVCTRDCTSLSPTLVIVLSLYKASSSAWGYYRLYKLTYSSTMIEGKQHNYTICIPEKFQHYRKSREVIIIKCVTSLY